MNHPDDRGTGIICGAGPWRIGIALVAVVLAVRPPSAAGAAGRSRFEGANAAHVALAERALAVLEDALEREEGWVRIHAAESLIDVGERARIRRQFERELPQLEASAFRIGAWRVLARSAASPDERARWVRKIEAVFLDPTSPDRLQAIETVGKLGVRLTGPAAAATREMADSIPLQDALFPLWARYLAGDNEALLQLGNALQAENPDARRRAGFVLRWLAPEAPWLREKLARAADREPADTVAHPNLAGAALLLDVDPARAAAWLASVERALEAGPQNVRLAMCYTLLKVYGSADLPRLTKFFDDPEGDTRIGTAWATLEILLRSGVRRVDN